MPENVRISLLALGFVFLSVGGYYRIQSQRSGERLDRTKEGWPILIGIRLLRHSIAGLGHARLDRVLVFQASIVSVGFVANLNWHPLDWSCQFCMFRRLAPLDVQGARAQPYRYGSGAAGCAFRRKWTISLCQESYVLWRTRYGSKPWSCPWNLATSRGRDGRICTFRTADKN